MNLRDLEYIAAVARYGHFGTAAEACHVSQPTLSGQIRKLEDYLGVQIFERSSRSVRLTPAGREIVALAHDVLEGAEAIKRFAESRRDMTSGPLRIGLIPTIAPYLVPLFVQPLKSAFPKLKPILVEDITDRLTAQLEDGSIDVAILATEPDARFKEMPVYREPFWLAMPAGHPLEREDSIDSADLPSDELLLLSEGHCFRDQALAVCAADRKGGDTDLRATSLETLLQLVSAGQGITLIPALMWDRVAKTAENISARPIRGEDAARTVRLVYRKGFPREPLLRLLAETIAQSVPDRLRLHRRLKN